jgi:hypothetical protein
MNDIKRKREIGANILIIVIAVGAYVGKDIYMKYKYPCKYRTYESLMKEYPELEKIWDRKMAYLDAREAAEKIFSAQLELATKRGTITEDQAMEKELKMFDQTLEGESKFEEEFQSMCRRLTGTE